MGVAVLAIPVVNKLLVKKVPITMIATALRCFTDHMEKEGGTPSLLKIFVDPIEPTELEVYLDEIIFQNKDSWAVEWGLPKDTRLDVLDFKKVKKDKDVAKSFFAALKEVLSDEGLKLSESSKLNMAKAILVASGGTEEVRTAIMGLDDTAVIALENAKLQEWVGAIVGERAWALLKGTKTSLISSERCLKEANKLADEWRTRALTAEKVADSRGKELDNMEAYLWKSGPKVFKLVLEEEGFLQPTRRMCEICHDKRKHTEPTVDTEDLNRSGNIEECCPLFSVGQRCEQCSAYPPECYSNDKVLQCKSAKEDPCQKMHYGKVPIHTSTIHQLDAGENLQLIKKLVDSYGVCNFPEYGQHAQVQIEVEDEMSF